MPERGPTSPIDDERFFTVTVEVPGPTADLFTGILVQLGARGLESIPDEGLELFPEVEPPRPGYERLVATFRDAGADERAAVERVVARHLATILAEHVGPAAEAPPPTRIEEVIPQDWARIWRSFFKPLRIGTRLVVRPSWERAELGPDDLELVMDPGLAFGTGSHETTWMCLEWVEVHAAGHTLLDVGTGTGVLSLAAARLGARRVLGTDNDPAALAVARENILINKLVGKVELSARTPADLEETYERIVANILPHTLLELAGEIAGVLAPGGELALSGILTEHVDQVSAAFQEQGLEEVTRLQRGEWHLIHLRRPGAAG